MSGVMSPKTGRWLGIVMNLAMAAMLLGLLSVAVVLGLFYYAALN